MNIGFLSVLGLASIWLSQYQSHRLVQLCDWSYMNENAYRISLGQIPYKDFGLVVAPGSFLVQGALMKVFGASYTVQKWYVCLGAFLCVAFSFLILKHLTASTLSSFLLSIPVVMGNYVAYPFPGYNDDVALASLFAIYLITQLSQVQSLAFAFFAGTALGIPLLFKQNTGAAAIVGGCLAVMGLYLLGPLAKSRKTLLLFFSGLLLSLGVILSSLLFFAGSRDLAYWLFIFPSQARVTKYFGLDNLVEGMALSKAGIAQLAFWGLLGLGTVFPGPRRFYATFKGALFLSAAVFAPYGVAWIRGSFLSRLLDLWPITVLIAFSAFLFSLKKGADREKLRQFLLVSIGLGISAASFMAQPFDVSCHSLWPFLVLAWAYVLEQLPGGRRLTLSVACMLSVLAGFYLTKNHLFRYVAFNEPWAGSTHPKWVGMGTAGKAFPQMDHMYEWAAREIPFEDSVLAIPGEDAFYSTTGRAPQLALHQMIKATYPHPGSWAVEEARRQNIQWIILKTLPQLNIYLSLGDGKKALEKDYQKVAELPGYEIYRIAP